MKLHAHVFLPFAVCLLSAQQPAAVDSADLCRIEGQVVNAVTGEPVRRANITLGLSGAGPSAPSLKATVSDAEGRFALEDLAAGTYVLRTERTGFLLEAYVPPPATTSMERVTLSAGQVLKLEVKLVPQSVIAGKVVDEEGEPVPRTLVRAVQASRLRGQGGGGGQANDLGEFRIITGAGRYVLAAMPTPPPSSSGSPSAFLTTYYPSAPDAAGATPLEVRAGQELYGLTITLRKGRVYRVDGKVIMAATNVPFSSVRLQLLPGDRNAAVRVGLSALGGGVKPDGTFELTNVEPGSYYLTAVPSIGVQMAGERPRFFGRELVVVSDADLKGLAITVAGPLQIKGTIRMEGREKADFSMAQFMVRPLEGIMMGGPTPTAAIDGAFHLDNVPPYRLQLIVTRLPAGAYVKSVRVRGVEVPDSGLDLTGAASPVSVEVVASPDGAAVEGTVLDGDKPALTARVVLIPDPPRPAFLDFRVTLANPSGTFKFTGMAPGAYRLHAFDESAQFDVLASDPELQKNLDKTAVKLSLKEGETKKVEVKIEKVS